jgi:hypothetical protein
MSNEIEAVIVSQQRKLRWETLCFCDIVKTVLTGNFIAMI